MEQNRTRKGHGSSSAHSPKWRKWVIRSMITAVVLAVVAMLCRFMWISAAYTNAVFNIVIALISSGIIGDIAYLTKKVKEVKTQEERERYIYYIVLSIIVIIVIATCLFITIVYWENKKSKSQGQNGAVEVGAGSVVDGNQPSEIENGLKDKNEFSWIGNIYIIDSGDYIVLQDKTGGIVILIEYYLEHYPETDGNVVKKSDEELNQGAYGQYIALAKAYEVDKNACEMIDVKVYALTMEIEQRTFACGEYKKYDNLKILGDCYQQEIAWCELEDFKKQEILESALQSYIEALACAYNDPKATKSYIIEIWDEIIEIYGKLYLLEGLDESHKEQILVIIKACEQCKQSLLLE